MAGQAPFRHGVDWGRNQQTPASPVGVAARNPFQIGGLTPYQPEATAQQQGVVPVQVLYAFFQALPDPTVQQLTQVIEGHWSHSATTSSRIALSTFSVPSQFVYVLTDIYYYATCPSSSLAGPPVSLSAYQMAGLVHFELSLGDRQPMRLDATMFNPYGAGTASNAQASGWSMLDTPFGARRGGAFALYARSSMVVKVEAVVDVVPRFSITKIGAHFHGFAVPEGTFDTIFRRIKGGV